MPRRTTARPRTLATGAGPLPDGGDDDRLSALLSAFVSPWFLLLTGFVALNQLAFVAFGNCPSSWVLRATRRPGRLRPMSAWPIGRLGRFADPPRGSSSPGRVAVGLGMLAPRVETALSGAGWQANGSESVAVREQVDRNFAGAGAYALQVAVHSAAAHRRRPGLPPHPRPGRARPRRRPRGRQRSIAAPARRLDLARRPHGGGPRQRRQGPERNGRRRRRPQVRSSPPPPPRGSKPTSPAPPACGRTSTKPTATRC